MRDLIKLFKTVDNLQKNCKHKHTQIVKNSGDYIFRKSCKDCGKVLDWEFKNK